jgi:hypothetical protein
MFDCKWMSPTSAISQFLTLRILLHLQNKASTQGFISDSWVDPSMFPATDVGSKLLFLSGGFPSETTAAVLNKTELMAVGPLKCDHEEAYTRVTLHAKYSAKRLVIHANDTDIIVMGI